MKFYLTGLVPQEWKSHRDEGRGGERSAVRRSEVVKQHGASRHGRSRSVSLQRAGLQLFNLILFWTSKTVSLGVERGKYDKYDEFPDMAL